MKRVIAWMLVLVLCLGLFAGCKKNKDTDPTTGDTTVSTAGLEAALEYIKTVYRKPSEKTPKDFQRIGVVPVNGTEYEVVWTADVGEEYIKVVKGTDGMVTIDVNENVESEVKYVLTATISDAAGNSVSHSWKHLIPTAGNMLSIVEDAYKLEPGEAFDYEVTLTGKITAINTPWDAGYKNITVTIVVEGAEDKPIMCYRLKGEGADKLKPNDIITVTGIIKNYNGTIEFDAGCTLNAVIEGEEIKAPTDPKQIIKEAYELAEGGALPYKATLTGVITKVNTEYSPQYKNVTVTMVVGGDKDHPIQCYRLAGNGADKIDKDDTITVTGWIVNYKGTVQFNQGCTLDSWKDTGANVPKPEDTFTTTLVPEIVTEPKAGVAYKFFMFQKNYDKNFYLNGEMDGFYYATTYDPAKAADVYVEEVTGGYRLYIMKSGVKNYIEVLRQYSTSTSKYHNNVVFSTSPSKVWEWNSAIKSFTTEVDVDGTPTDFYLGTYSYYKTFSASPLSYVTGENADALDKENFVGRLATMKETKVTPEEKAFEQLKLDYPTDSNTTHSTDEAYTRKNVYEIDGTKVKVEWTANSNAVTIVDNGNGTVTVKVTRGDVSVPYTLTATITNGSEKLTTTWKCEIPPKPVAVADGTYVLYLPSESVVMNALSATTSNTYGYISAADVTEQGNNLIGMTASAIYTIKNGANQTIRLIDSDGRYLYSTEQYNSFNVAEEAPETGADWVLEKAEGGKFYIRNVATNKFLSFATNYGNFGAYADGAEGAVKGQFVLKAMKAEDVVITAEMAAAILEAEYAESIEAGCELVDTFTYEGTEFTVTWTVTPADSAAVKVEGGKLVYAPQEEVVEYTLTATVANGDDVATVDFEGKVPAAGAELFIPKAVETPEVGTGYKLHMYQASLEKDLYFNGEMAGYYLGTTEDMAEAVDVYLEEAEGGYNFYFMDGETKKYIVVYENNGYINVKIDEAAGAVYAYSETANTYVVTIGEKECYLGTYGTKTDIRPSETWRITGENASAVGTSQFVAQFAILVTAAQDVEEKEPPVEVGVPYKYYMYQASLEKALYFNGEMAGYYLGTTDNMDEAVDVYLEEAEGGYNFYFMDGETKKYIVVYENNGYINVKIDEAAGAVYTYSETANTYVVTIGERECYLGTYGTKTDIRPSETWRITGENASAVGTSQFVAQFGTVVLKEVGLIAVETPEVGTGYMLHMYQTGLEKDLYFNGEMAGYYLGTTEDMAEAVDVYLEEAEGGYNFYFMDGETKKYIVVYENNGYINVKIDEAAGAVYAYSKTANTYVVTIGEKECYLGTYGTKTDIRPSETWRITGENASAVGTSQFVAGFATIGFVSENEEEPEPEPAPNATTYTRVTDLANVTDGNYVIAVLNGENYEVLGTTVTDNKINATEEIVVTDNAISEATSIWTITVDGGNITLNNGTKYLKYNSSTNFGTSDDAYNWVITETADGIFCLTASTDSTRMIGYQISGDRYGAYKSTNSEYSYELLLFKAGE